MLVRFNSGRLGLGKGWASGVGSSGVGVRVGCRYRSFGVLSLGPYLWRPTVLAALNTSLAWLGRLCSRFCFNEALILGLAWSSCSVLMWALDSVDGVS